MPPLLSFFLPIIFFLESKEFQKEFFLNKRYEKGAIPWGSRDGRKAQCRARRRAPESGPPGCQVKTSPFGRWDNLLTSPQPQLPHYLLEDYYSSHTTSAWRLASQLTKYVYLSVWHLVGVSVSLWWPVLCPEKVSSPNHSYSTCISYM